MTLANPHHRQSLKDLYDRKASAMVRRPGFGRGTGQARICLTDGLACDVDQGNRTVRVDLPIEEGGTNTGPHPGQLMRASIGACLAMGYAVWAARMEVPLDNVQLELTCDFDARGQMALAEDVAIGWQRLVVDVTIASSAPEAHIRQIVDIANRCSPMLANLSPLVTQIHRLTVLPVARAPL